jgi:hypothetical protein
MKADMVNRAFVGGLLICAAVATSLAWVEDNADAANTGDTNSADGKSDAVAIVAEEGHRRSTSKVRRQSLSAHGIPVWRARRVASWCEASRALSHEWRPVRVDGPRVVQCGDHAPVSISGTAQIEIDGRKTGRPSIRPAGTTLPAIAARRALGKPVPALSMAGTVTLERSPVFRWKAVERGLEYKFVLKDDGGSAYFPSRSRGIFWSFRSRWACRTVNPMCGRSEPVPAWAKTICRSIRSDETKLPEHGGDYRPAGDAPVAERLHSPSGWIK